MGSDKTGRGLDPYIAFRANATFVVVLALIVLFWLPMALVLALQGFGMSNAVVGPLFLALILGEIVALVAWQTWRSVLFGHLRSVHDLTSPDERIPFPIVGSTQVPRTEIGPQGSARIGGVTRLDGTGSEAAGDLHLFAHRVTEPVGERLHVRPALRVALREDRLSRTPRPSGGRTGAPKWIPSLG